MNKNVQTTHSLISRFENLLGLFFIRYIAMHIDRLAGIALPIGLFDECLSGFVIDVDGIDSGPLTCKLIHRCRTDAASTTGNDDLLPCKQFFVLEHLQ